MGSDDLSGPHGRELKQYTTSAAFGQNDQAPDTGVPKVYRVVKTVIIAWALCFEGIVYGLNTPALLDLMQLYHADCEQVSDGLTGRSAGLLVAAVLGSYVFNRFSRHQDVLLSVSMLAVGVATAALPWARYTVLLGVLTFFQGVGAAFLFTGGNTAMIQMWGEEAMVPLHLAHVGLGVGIIVAPLFAEPFLAPLCDHQNVTRAPETTVMPGHSYRHDAANNSVLKLIHSTHGPGYTKAPSFVDKPASNIWADGLRAASVFTQVSAHHQNGNPNASILCGPSMVQIPYGITGAGCLLTTIAFIFLHSLIKSPTKTDVKEASSHDESNERSHKGADSGEKGALSSLKDTINPASCTGGRLCFGIQFIALFYLLSFTYGASKVPLTNFLYAIAVESELQFSKTLATTLVTTNGIAYTAGKFLPAMLSLCLPTKFILIGEPLLVFLSFIFLALFGVHSQSVFWICTCFYSLAQSALFPTSLVWANAYITVGSSISALSIIGDSTGGLAATPLAGYVYEEMGIMALLYMACICAGVATAMSITIQIVASCQSDCTCNANKTEVDIEDHRVSVNDSEKLME
ncbi:sodium-dependent glucose transporter 1-like [Lingula anatina]|uniref:Sodium-dependent glucose transporter 1-like n=1 Tax=Lingula anatina TaxID=7574 RepID=A0A2R2MRF2_LINAN|nr:sodium-dependent glucose transporter 1-like [Lingula anatina]|eukprot:XP_023932834.1 sodium-dependent glucose transporter 1-like [Lingula anatina]